MFMVLVKIMVNICDLELRVFFGFLSHQFSAIGSVFVKLTNKIPTRNIDLQLICEVNTIK